MSKKACRTLVAVALAGVLSAVGCSQPKNEPQPEPKESSASRLSEASSEIAPPELNVGDAEAGILLMATLSPDSNSPQITADEMENKRDRLNMVTVNVRPPYPQKLAIRVSVAPRVSFEAKPVVLRGKMRRDEQPIEQQYSGIVSTHKPGGGTVDQFDVDVMQGLSAPPETMLVYARLDAWMMPNGTPTTGLDPNTADSQEHTELLSNPVRINFLKEGAAN